MAIVKTEKETVEGVAAAPHTATDPQWYKDAVIYELHVKAFFDANDDGTGDFPGLTEKLDYVADLGAVSYTHLTLPTSDLV